MTLDGEAGRREEQSMLLRAARIVLVIVLGLVAVRSWRENYEFAVQLEWVTRGHDPDSYLLDEFYPGLPAAVRLLRDAAPAAIYCLRHEQDPRVHQLLLEMLYPLRPAPYEPARLKRGDLVALDAGRELEVPSEELFRRGMVEVLRVR